MNAPANFESLPQELRDLVVDHMPQMPDNSERTRALLSIALVSRQFRYWAHKRLFSTVVLRGKHRSLVAGSAFRRLCQLKDLINADPQSEMTGIASHIRSFTLILIGHLSDAPPTVTPLVEGALSFIFRKLFRNGNGQCSLSVLFCVPIGRRLDWKVLGHDFRCALLDVVRSTHLSILRLRGISNLPDDILVCSAVDHISVKDVSIRHHMQSELPPCDEQSYRDCIQPYSIETDHSFPITHILDLTPTHSQPWHFIFQNLRELTIKINDSDGFAKSTELFKSATSIKNLEIKLNYTSSSRAALSFQPLHGLRHLRLIHQRRIPTHGILSIGHTHVIVQDIIDLLGYSPLPRSLRGVSIHVPLMPCYWHRLHPEVPFGYPANQGSTIPSTMTIMKRIALWSPENNIFKPLDDLLGGSSIESQGQFADIRCLTFRLELELYDFPREYSEQKFAKEAARCVKSEFFPKVKERFERVDQSSGRFRVVVLPKFLG